MVKRQCLWAYSPCSQVMGIPTTRSQERGGHIRAHQGLSRVRGGGKCPEGGVSSERGLYEAVSGTTSGQAGLTVGLLPFQLAFVSAICRQDHPPPISA